MLQKKAESFKKYESIVVSDNYDFKIDEIHEPGLKIDKKLPFFQKEKGTH